MRNDKNVIKLLTKPFSKFALSNKILIIYYHYFTFYVLDLHERRLS